MALRMVALNRAADHRWFARKGIPEDIREDYAKLYRVRREEHLKLPADTPRHEAKTRLGDPKSRVSVPNTTLGHPEAVLASVTKRPETFTGHQPERRMDSLKSVARIQNDDTNEAIRPPKRLALSKRAETRAVPTQLYQALHLRPFSTHNLTQHLASARLAIPSPFTHNYRGQIGWGKSCGPSALSAGA